jgi:alkylation response protein AidB-like acyl-CoA dehydrogenase
MRFLEMDRRTCDTLLPGLLTELAAVPQAELEAPLSPAIGLFRTHGGSNLLVPGAFGGLDATALDAARVVRALGAAAPSLAVATAMHHFSIGTLYGVADVFADSSDLDEILLKRVAEERLLVASGFAEGRSGQGILSPTLTARPVDGGYLLTGSKKPCSLSQSMDLLTASVGLPQPDGTAGFGLLLLPADTPGISVHPFWRNFALAGAESDEVRLTDVFVTDAQILQLPPEFAELFVEQQQVGLIWFQMIVCAAYTGIASALVDQVLARTRGTAADRAALAVRAESAAALTEGIARRVMAGDVGNDGLVAALANRFTVQDLIRDTVGHAVELLGGMAFITSSEVAYLVAAAQAIGFHPPSRASMAEGMAGHYTDGTPLVVS